jgi:hypothetical protein
VASYLFASSDEVFEEGEYVNFNVKATNIGETEGSYTMRAQARKSPARAFNVLHDSHLAPAPPAPNPLRSLLI